MRRIRYPFPLFFRSKSQYATKPPARRPKSFNSCQTDQVLNLKCMTTNCTCQQMCRGILVTVTGNRGRVRAEVSLNGTREHMYWSNGCAHTWLRHQTGGRDSLYQCNLRFYYFYCPWRAYPCARDGRILSRYLPMRDQENIHR